MSVLVAYAGEHGATQEIADRIAGRLQRRGLDVALAPVESLGSLAGPDAVVLGSAIHNGQWLPAAAAVADREAPVLVARPLWLFSVGMVGDTGSAFGARLTPFLRRRQPVPAAVAALLGAATPGRRPVHRRFAGVFLREHTSWWGAALYRAMGGRFGDHRDWSDVDAWADTVAEQLHAQAELHAQAGGPAAS